MRRCTLHLYTTEVSSVSQQIIKVHYERRWEIRAEGRGKKISGLLPSTWNKWIFFMLISVKAELDPYSFFFYFSDKNANKGERISFRSWPIGYDKLVTPITLGTSELSKWWDHISVWRLVHPERAQTLSLNQPPYLLHLTVSHEREGRESEARWRCLGPD